MTSFGQGQPASTRTSCFRTHRYRRPPHTNVRRPNAYVINPGIAIAAGPASRNVGRRIPAHAYVAPESRVTKPIAGTGAARHSVANTTARATLSTLARGA